MRSCVIGKSTLTKVVCIHTGDILKCQANNFDNLVLVYCFVLKLNYVSAQLQGQSQREGVSGLELGHILNENKQKFVP